MMYALIGMLVVVAVVYGKVIIEDTDKHYLFQIRLVSEAFPKFNCEIFTIYKMR